MTAEEAQASQRQFVLLVGIPGFIWYLYKTFSDRAQNYYDILQIGFDFSSSAVKKQFYRMSKEMHPDKGGSEDAFVLLQSAYEILKDNKKRKLYDKFGPGFDECRTCNNVEDYYNELMLPAQISFFIGCCVVIWMFGGGRMPRTPFLVLLFFILGIQVAVTFGESALIYNLQMLPFELTNNLYILWGTLLSAQMMFSGVWGNDSRTEREILLQIEQHSLQTLNQLHQLACIHDVNIRDPQLRTKLVKLIEKRDTCFQPLYDNPEQMESFMKPDSFEFNIHKHENGVYTLLSGEDAENLEEEGTLQQTEGSSETKPSTKKKKKKKKKESLL